MQKNLKLLGVIAILGASLAISGFAFQDVMAANGANKSVYSTNKPTAATEGTDVLLANVTMKTAKPTDALVLYNEECSLYTAVELKSHKSKTGAPGEELDEVKASHKIYLKVDGTVIDQEPKTMCDRTYGMETNILNQIQDLCVAVDILNQTAGGENQ